MKCQQSTPNFTYIELCLCVLNMQIMQGGTIVRAVALKGSGFEAADWLGPFGV